MQERKTCPVRNVSGARPCAACRGCRPLQPETCPVRDVCSVPRLPARAARDVCRPRRVPP